MLKFYFTAQHSVMRPGIPLEKGKEESSIDFSCRVKKGGIK